MDSTSPTTYSDTLGTTSLKCINCGAQKLRAPDSPKPEDAVTCLGCGSGFKLQLLIDERSQRVRDEFTTQNRGATKE